MEKRLVVEVRGEIGSGKSTAAAVIAHHLIELGAEVTIGDDSSIFALAKKYQYGRIALRGVQVEVRTKQLARTEEF